MYRLLLLFVLFMGLGACSGGGSSNDVEEDPIVDDGSSSGGSDDGDSDDDDGSDDDGDTNTIADPIFPPDLSVTSCEGFDYIDTISVASSAVPVDDFIADNIIDNNLNETHSWQTNENGAQATIDLGYRHEVKEVGLAWANGDSQTSSFDLEVSEDGVTFSTILSTQSSSGETLLFDRYDISDSVARFVRITSYGTSTDGVTMLSELGVWGCPLDTEEAPIETQTVDIDQYNLDSTAAPGSNFDLLTWALDTPAFDPEDGLSQRSSESELEAGFEDEFFYTASDGGMAFKSTIFGARTSQNTSYTRSELREMLRRGDTSIRTTGVNENNWILGYQPDPETTVGGRGGVLKATLKLEHVTTTGSNTHEGRVIIGQIHADDDEPIRLYYKKFADNDKGYIYFGHEIRESDDIWRVVIGHEHTDDDDQPIYSDEPAQGIELGEVFSYEIDQSGSRIDVIIRRGDLNGPIIGHQYVDMAIEDSGYDIIDEWMYFKAGLYTQNNTGETGDENGVGSDYDQAVFYYLSNEHGPQ